MTETAIAPPTIEEVVKQIEHYQELIRYESAKSNSKPTLLYIWKRTLKDYQKLHVKMLKKNGTFSKNPTHPRRIRPNANGLETQSLGCCKKLKLSPSSTVF